MKYSIELLEKQRNYKEEILDELNRKIFELEERLEELYKQKLSTLIEVKDLYDTLDKLE